MVWCIHDHCLAVHEGRIVAIVPNAESSQYQATTQIKLPNHVLMPGLINAHGHAAMTLMRGIADDLPLMEWLNEHIMIPKYWRY